MPGGTPPVDVPLVPSSTAQQLSSWARRLVEDVINLSATSAPGASGVDAAIVKRIAQGGGNLVQLMARSNAAPAKGAKGRSPDAEAEYDEASGDEADGGVIAQVGAAKTASEAVRAAKKKAVSSAVKAVKRLSVSAKPGSKKGGKTKLVGGVGGRGGDVVGAGASAPPPATPKKNKRGAGAK